VAEPLGRNHKLFGEMAEWFMAAVLKTVVGLHLTGGSNPSLSVVVLDHTKKASRHKPLLAASLGEYMERWPSG
jgi:hypothetical protein